MAQVTRGAAPEGLAVRGMLGRSDLFLLLNRLVQSLGPRSFWLRGVEDSCWVTKFSFSCKAKQHFPPLGSSHRFPEVRSPETHIRTPTTPRLKPGVLSGSGNPHLLRGTPPPCGVGTRISIQRGLWRDFGTLES